MSRQHHAARAWTLAPAVHAAFTARHPGVSRAPYDGRNLGLGVGDDPQAVAANRHDAARELGFGPESVVWMSQVHGRDVATVDHPGPAGRVDASVTGAPGVVLAVLVADCLPVMVADPRTGVRGVAHSGRIGTELQVAAALVARMAELGAAPERCVALLGPAICGGCYEVGAELRAQVARSAPEAACETREGTPGVDMRAAVTAQLRRAGVADIRHDDRCTRESPELYSHRRDGRTGRFAGFLWQGDE